jgi:hypothetical protein
MLHSSKASTHAKLQTVSDCLFAALAHAQGDAYALFSGIATLVVARPAATVSSDSAIVTGHVLPQMHSMLMTDLPKDVLSRIISYLQEDSWQRSCSLDDVAALRSVCCSLRHATDLLVTHAKFHANIDVEELRSMTRRCAGK